MDDLLESKLMIGVIVFFTIFLYLGGIVTKDVNTSKTINERIIINI